MDYHASKGLSEKSPSKVREKQRKEQEEELKGSQGEFRKTDNALNQRAPPPPPAVSDSHLELLLSILYTLLALHRKLPF
ncbi:conserved hypothetical protein [Ricinus communis]|uniref:Uncharacterized protein n=1 Tax=Ricinus communis TaxID=3988 RepID=B9RTB4_RICCO|nr:conserved hypothetical protein [Ricinus communis]